MNSRRINWRRLDKLFMILTLFSGVLNIGLVFFITNNRFHEQVPLYRSYVAPIWESRTVTLTKENYGKEFSIEVYRFNDIVSTALQGDGWEYGSISSLNDYFNDYSLEHNIPLNNLTFIDIGANVGWFSLNMAALGVKVLAFEPMVENIEIIQKSLEMPDNIKSGVSERITLFGHGLGTKDETCFVYADNNNVGDGHVKCVEKESDLNMEDGYSLYGSVPVKRLDDVVKAEGMHIVAIKMDAEGSEGNVLEGGTELFLKGGVDVIITEFNPATIVDKGGDPVEFMKKMSDAGYRGKRDWWGEYFSSEELIDFTSRSSEIMTFHSPAQVNRTKLKDNFDYGNLDGDDLFLSNYYGNNTSNETTSYLDNDGETFTMATYPENDIISSAIYQSWGWETDTVASLNTLFRDYSKVHSIPLKDLTFIDIGANIGWLSFNMAALGVKVLAFEPMVENIEIIQKSLEMPDNIKSGVSERITLYGHGLGTKDETCFVYADNNNVGDGHVKCVEKESDLNMEDGYSLHGHVPVKRLDDVIKAKGMHIVAINLDTEGFEGNVLEGGTKLFLKGGVDVIITKFDPDNIVGKGGDPVEFMKKMSDAGYRAKKEWGYMRKEEMINITQYRTDLLTFHSPTVIKQFLA